MHVLFFIIRRHSGYAKLIRERRSIQNEIKKNSILFHYIKKLSSNRYPATTRGVLFYEMQTKKFSRKYKFSFKKFRHPRTPYLEEKFPRDIYTIFSFF